MGQHERIIMFRSVGKMGCAINQKRELGCWNLKGGKRVEDLFANIIVNKKLNVSYVSLSDSHICVINGNEG